ncbi:hypothetical protein DY245_06565 [Streptomyces inhibens]|uniref:Uncharacterized protein n=1 Tax=Streptomyces inhibens TaxID=2293571 RepID=A0A371Q8T2_STRIH|nr:hypothetical protein DY245_06565 [Streptomyces inhibens]
MIRKGLKSPYEAASKLRSALEKHGLEVPDLTVQQGKVDLGTITVQTGDALALLLGADPQSLATDLEDWDAGWRLADRLGAAVKKATGGDLPDIKFHSYCARGCGSAALELGSLPAATARRLAATLRKAKARQPQRETTAAERHTA